MTDDGMRGGLLGGAGQRTTERVGGHDAEVSQPRELTWDRMKRRALEALFVLVGVPLLMGPWALVVYVPLYLERVAYAVADWFDLDIEVNRLSMACFGLLVGLALLVAPDSLLSWWPFWWQRSAASFRGLLWPGFWPAAIPVVLLLRVTIIAVSLAAWPEVWYLDQRQRQGTIAPTLDSVAYDTVHPGSAEIPGVYNVHRLPGAEPDIEDEPRTYGDIIIHREAPADSAQVLASNAVTGAPSVAVGGNGNGHHTATARVPLSMMGGDKRHYLDLIRILHDAYGDLAAGEQLSRANLRRHGLSDTQARELSGWFRDHGFATIDRANRHTITDAGHDYIAVALDGIEEARRRLE